MITAVLADARGGAVSLLFTSGASIEGTLVGLEVGEDGVPDAPRWAVVLEHLEVTVGGATRERAMRHTLDTGDVVAVGVIDP